MNTTTIRQQLHNYLEVGEKKKKMLFIQLLKKDLEKKNLKSAEEKKKGDGKTIFRI